jgi:cytochrome c551
MTARSLTLGLALALTLTACGDKEGDTGGDVEEVCTSEGANGASLYATSCSGCHGADGSGSSGPSLIDAMPQLSDEDVSATISEGGTTMPAFDGTLDCSEQAAVLEYLRDQHGNQGGS